MGHFLWKLGTLSMELLFDVVQFAKKIYILSIYSGLILKFKTMVLGYFHFHTIRVQNKYKNCQLFASLVCIDTSHVFGTHTLYESKHLRL